MVSRIAKSPVEVPSGVEVKLDRHLITIKGKNGELSHASHPAVKLAHNDNQIIVQAVNGETEANALAGTIRSLVSNMVQGVVTGFERKLTLIGVGYRAKAQGSKLNLTVGFSHPVNMEMPAGISVATPSNTEIVISGADKQKVCQVAANIRAIRPPEPYKGKGIRYSDERIKLKEAKKK